MTLIENLLRHNDMCFADLLFLTLPGLGRWQVLL
jgi:hypothetical protein